MDPVNVKSSIHKFMSFFACVCKNKQLNILPEIQFEKLYSARILFLQKCD